MSMDRAYWLAHRMAMQEGGDVPDDIDLAKPRQGSSHVPPAVSDFFARHTPSAIADIPREIYNAGADALRTMYPPKPPELPETATPQERFRAAAKRPIGPGITGLVDLATSPFSGTARSLLGHPLSTVAQVPYEEAKKQVDLAMLGLGPRGGLRPAGVPAYTGPGLRQAVGDFLIPPEASGVPETTLGMGYSRRRLPPREPPTEEELAAARAGAGHNQPPEPTPAEPPAPPPESLEQPPIYMKPERTPLTTRYEKAAEKTPGKIVDLGPFPFRSGEDVGLQAQRYVVARGMPTGIEHLVGITGTGAVIAHGHGAPNYVGITPALSDAIYDPNGSVVIHHNHPSNTSFSGADISMLGAPGLDAMWAHGHGGAVYRAALLPEAREVTPGVMDLRRMLFDAHKEARDAIYPPLAVAVRTGAISRDAAWALQAALPSEIMDRAGIIDYRSNVETAPDIARLGLKRYVEEAAHEAARRFYGHNYAVQGFNDRRAESFRHVGEVGATFEPAPIAPDEYAATPAIYQQRGANARRKAREPEQLDLFREGQDQDPLRRAAERNRAYEERLAAQRRNDAAIEAHDFGPDTSDPNLGNDDSLLTQQGFAETRRRRLPPSRQIPVEAADEPAAMNPRAVPGANRPPEAVEHVPLGTDPKEAALTVNELLHPDYPAQPPRSRGVEDIAGELQDRGRDAWAALGITAPKKSEQLRITKPAPQTDEVISRAIASEIKAAIERGGSASDWYTSKVQEAMSIASMIYPELATDPAAKLGFTAALAITSQGETVSSNVRLADEVYRKFRQTGRFPTNVSADAQKSMNGNFKKLNKLLADHGPEKTAEFLNGEFTVRELEQLGHSIGGENMGTKVNGSAIFGPKIGGGFFQNLNGNYDPVTMDLWFMRGWGRLTGTLKGLPDLTKQRARFEAALEAEGQKVPRTMPALERLAEDIVKKHEIDFRTNRGDYDSGAKAKSELTYAAERVLHGLNGINETPKSGGQRDWIRARINRVRELLAAEGHELTNADLQAIWWYPEKELYAKLGGRDAEGINTDYASALRELARKRGIADEDIARAMGTTHNRSGSAAAADVGPGDRGLLQESRGSDGAARKGKKRGPAAEEVEGRARGGAVGYADGGPSPFDFDTAFPTPPKPGVAPTAKPVVKPDLATGFNFEQAFPAQRPPQPPMEKDIIQAIPRGLMTGAREFFDTAMSAGLPPESKIGLAQHGNMTFQQIDEAERQAGAKAREFSRGVQNRAEEAIGVPHESATGPGRIMEGTASFFGNPVSWFGPEGWGAKAAMATTSGLGSSLAGEATKGTKYEVPARIAGALAAPQVAARTLAPRVRPEVQRLLDSGVDRMTVGQLFPGPNQFFKRAEDTFDTFPILGAFVKRGRERSIESFNRTVGDQALEPIGQSVSRRVAGHELISEVEDKLSGAYNSVLPHLTFVPDKQFALDLNAIHTGPVTRMPVASQEQFTKIVDSLLPAGAKLDGRMYKDIESELNHIAKSYGSSMSASERQLGSAVGDVVSAMRQGLERSNPGYGDILGRINTGWAMYARMRDAATRAPSQTGVFTPAQLLAAIKSGDKSVAKGTFAKGDALMQAFAEAGQKVLPSKIGSSGTAERLLHTGTVAGFLGGEHALHLPVEAMVGTAGVGLAGAAPYTNIGQAALNKYVRPGALRSLYRDAATSGLQPLRSAAPTLPGLMQPGLNPYAQP